jgi:hypothetical protein
MSPVDGLTMVLMDIDTRIGLLYNDILGELDEMKRTEAYDELQNLKVTKNLFDDICEEKINLKAKKVFWEF